MDESPIDFSPLDPTADPVRWAGLQRRIGDAAAPELARRAGAPGGFAVLAQWSRPIFAAAAVLAVLSGGIIRITHPMATDTAVGSVAEALGFPAPVAEWLADGRDPDEDDLLLALDRRTR